MTKSKRFQCLYHLVLCIVFYGGLAGMYYLARFKFHFNDEIFCYAMAGAFFSLSLSLIAVVSHSDDRNVKDRIPHFALCLAFLALVLIDSVCVIGGCLSRGNFSWIIGAIFPLVINIIFAFGSGFDSQDKLAATK